MNTPELPRRQLKAAEDIFDKFASSLHTVTRVFSWTMPPQRSLLTRLFASNTLILSYCFTAFLDLVLKHLSCRIFGRGFSMYGRGWRLPIILYVSTLKLFFFSFFPPLISRAQTTVEVQSKHGKHMISPVILYEFHRRCFKDVCDWTWTTAITAGFALGISSFLCGACPSCLHHCYVSLSKQTYLQKWSQLLSLSSPKSCPHPSLI